jgi:hypothetical protein
VNPQGQLNHRALPLPIRHVPTGVQSAWLPAQIRTPVVERELGASTSFEFRFAVPLRSS